MKKVCIISLRFDPDLGGSELLAKSIADYFSQYSLVEIITTKNIERKKFIYSYNICEVDEINFISFNEIIKNNNYDLCLFVSDLQSPFLNYYEFGCKNNYCILNVDERVYLQKNLFENSTNNLKKFDNVFTFTINSVANKFLEENNIKNIYVPNFSRDVLKTKTDFEFKQKIKNLFKNDSKIILYNAAFEERKNQKYLLNLLNGSSSLREFNWIFIGTTPNKNYLEECIYFSKQNKLNAVFLKSTKNLEYIDKLYQISDLVCLTSIAEGMPLVLIEAISAGIPWVCTDVGGVKGVLGSSQTGEIIPVNYTQNILYNSIKKSLNNHNFEKTRNFWLENFNKEDIMKKYESIILG